MTITLLLYNLRLNILIFLLVYTTLWNDVLLPATELPSMQWDSIVPLAILSGFYPPKSGIKIRCNFPPFLG